MGKGSKPRNCFTKAFRDGHDAIDWGRKSYKTCDRYDSTKCLIINNACVCCLVDLKSNILKCCQCGKELPKPLTTLGTTFMINGKDYCRDCWLKELDK